MKGRVRKGSYLTRVLGTLMESDNRREGAKRGMWITAVLTLDENPGFDQVKEVLEKRLLSMPRFKSTMDLKSRNGAFHELEEIDWEYHLSTPEFASEETTEKEVFDFSGRVVTDNSIELDTAKPLWRIFLFPKVKTAEGVKTLLIATINHCIGDGVSLMGVLYKITDNAPIDPLIPVSKQTSDNVVNKRKILPKFGILTRTSVFIGGAFEALFGAFGRNDPKTSLSKADNSIVGNKLYGNAKSIPLEELKELKNSFKSYGMTINDVLLTILSMTVKAYLEETGELRSNLKIRSNFPVSLQTVDQPLLPKGDPRNCFSMASFSYMLKYTSPIDCLFKVKNQLDKAKISPLVPISFAFGKVASKVLGRSILVPLSYRLADKSTTMFSNVPGPQKPLEFGGKTVEKLSFQVQYKGLLYFGLLTYNNQVELSLSIDERLNIPPEKLLDQWTKQYKLLATEVKKYSDLVASGTPIPRSEKERSKLLATLAST